MTFEERLKELINAENHELIASQESVSIHVVERLYKKMRAEVRFPAISVYDKRLIINGHHRYLASKLAGIEIERSTGLKSSAKEPREWNLVLIDKNDRDSAEEVTKHNETDAKYMEITVEELNELVEKIK